MEGVSFIEKAKAVGWAYKYEKFLSSLQEWANTTIITKVRPLMIPETEGNVHRQQWVGTKRNNYNHITNKNENLLINRKLGVAGNLDAASDWMEPALYEDLINSLDERTKKHLRIKEEKRKADAEKWGVSQKRPTYDHPLEQYLPSELRNNEWVDEQGKNLQMHKEDFTRDFLDIVATQKDSNYVGKSAATYLKTQAYSAPSFWIDRKTDKPPQYIDYKNRKNAWGHFLDVWKPRLTQNPAAMWCSQDERIVEGLFAIAEGAEIGALKPNEIVGFINQAYNEVSEKENMLPPFPDLDILLRDMVFLLEIFELDQTVLELDEFEIESRYQSADIDEDGMRDLWHEAIKGELSSDEGARFEEYPEEFEDDYPFTDFLAEKDWNDTEIIRTHGNRVRWVYDKNSPFLNYETDPQAQKYEIYAPSPFAKQYSPYLRASPYAERDKAWRNDPAKNLTGMRWGDYAWPNVFPIGSVLGVNEAPDTINTFVPIKFPNSLITVNKIAEETKYEPIYGDSYSPLESNIQLDAGYGLLDVTYSLARQNPSEPVISSLSSDEIYTDENNIGDDFQDNSEELTQLLGWEDNVGLHNIFLRLKIRFSTQPNRFINFVRGMPKKLLDLGTN